MIRKALAVRSAVFFALVLAVIPAAPSWAQGWDDGWSPQAQKHKIEITPYIGYTWTSSIDVQIENTFGKVDIESSESWGIEIDVNVQPGGQFTLLYHRQDSQLTFQPTGALKETLGDVSVEYLQIGGVGGVQKGNVMPFTVFTLGATRLAAKDQMTSDIWKFSLILGFGAKIYLNDHLGIRFHARLPWTVIDGGGVVACGGGGCYVAAGGTGFVQPRCRCGSDVVILTVGGARFAGDPRLVQVVFTS